ncbi:MAG: glycosyltransferase [Pseudomonadota bacterium]
MPILIGVLALSVTAVAYPFLIYPLILGLLPVRPVAPVGKPKRPKAAVLISARNEQAHLPNKLTRLRQLQDLWPGLRILIWDDASTDGTAQVLAAHADHVEVHRSQSQIGKTMALRNLHARLGPDIDVLFFADANTHAQPAAFLALARALDDPQVGAAAGTSVLTGGGTTLSRVYWALEERIKALESRSGSTIGCDGALWAVRRELYTPPEGYSSDDFTPSVGVLLSGHRVVSVADAIVREAAVRDGFVPARAMRIACGAWHGHRRIVRHLGQLSRLDQFKYRSHKLMRWFAGFWVLTGALTMLFILALVGGPAALFVVASAAAVGLLAGIPGVRTLSLIVLTFLATSWGILRAELGHGIGHWDTMRDT